MHRKKYMKEKRVGSFNTVKRVLVRRCRALSGDGSWTVRETLFCPVLAHAVTIDDCLSCDRYRAVVLDERDRASAVECRDVGRSEMSMAWSPHPGDTPIWMVMTSGVVCVEADVSGEKLESLLLDGGFSGAPVVDTQGRLVGVVSKTDLVRDRYTNGNTEVVEPSEWSQPGIDIGVQALQWPTITVGEIMTPATYTLPEAAPVARAAALMAYEGIHRLPIVTPSNHVVGILTAADIVRHLAAHDGYIVPPTGLETRRRSWTLSAELADASEVGEHRG